MQRYMLYLKDRKVRKKCLNLPKQVVILSSFWTKGVEDFYKRYTKEAIVAISSRVEASVYGGVRQVMLGCLLCWRLGKRVMCSIQTS